MEKLVKNKNKYFSHACKNAADQQTWDKMYTHLLSKKYIFQQ